MVFCPVSTLVCQTHFTEHLIKVVDLKNNKTWHVIYTKNKASAVTCINRVKWQWEWNWHCAFHMTNVPQALQNIQSMISGFFNMERKKMKIIYLCTTFFQTWLLHYWHHKVCTWSRGKCWWAFPNSVWCHSGWLKLLLPLLIGIVF